MQHGHVTSNRMPRSSARLEFQHTPSLLKPYRSPTSGEAVQVASKPHRGRLVHAVMPSPWHLLQTLAAAGAGFCVVVDGWGAVPAASSVTARGAAVQPHVLFVLADGAARRAVPAPGAAAAAAAARWPSPQPSSLVFACFSPSLSPVFRRSGIQRRGLSRLGDQNAIPGLAQQGRGRAAVLLWPHDLHSLPFGSNGQTTL